MANLYFEGTIDWGIGIHN